MEFWGVEVKAGAPVKVNADVKKRIHLSQASLGEVKKDKGNDSIPLFLNANDQKLVIGTLSAGKISQISYDLVFTKKFELSHNWKNGSIYFCGYKSISNQSDDDSTDSDSDFGRGLPVIKDNGEPEPKNENANLSSKKSLAPKPKLKIAEPNKDDDSEEDSDDDEAPMDVSEEDSSDEEDESSDQEDEDTPKKSVQGKKRPADSSSKAPVSEKKVKLVTPQKTSSDAKKGGVVHVATPYPSKKAGKTPPSIDNSKQTQKSGGQVACKSCSKTFNSDKALESHTKAKHADAK